MADAAVRIFLTRGIEALLKWVDDFVFLCYPSGRLSDGTFTFNYDTDLIWDIAAELGWPWAPAKFVDFAPIFTYIGFLWNFPAKLVELPEKKKVKYLDRLTTWTHKSTHNLKETESLIGTLNHVCLVVPEGRSHLVSLYKFRGGFRASHPSEMRHRLSAGAAEDMDWWRRRLQEPFVGMRIV